MENTKALCKFSKLENKNNCSHLGGVTVQELKMVCSNCGKHGGDKLIELPHISNSTQICSLKCRYETYLKELHGLSEEKSKTLSDAMNSK